jgi:hypothetical protein
MNLRDLETAKRLLFEKKLTLCIVKNGDAVFESTTQGIAPFLECVEKFKARLEGSAAADKVVGKPVALLCAYAKLDAIHAGTMSAEALKLLKKYSIYFEYDLLVERILRSDRKGICPFDRLMRGVADPVEAYEKLKNVCSPNDVSSVKDESIHG